MWNTIVGLLPSWDNFWNGIGVIIVFLFIVIVLFGLIVGLFFLKKRFFATLRQSARSVGVVAMMPVLIILAIFVIGGIGRLANAYAEAVLQSFEIRIGK